MSEWNRAVNPLWQEQLSAHTKDGSLKSQRMYTQGDLDAILAAEREKYEQDGFHKTIWDAAVAAERERCIEFFMSVLMNARNALVSGGSPEKVEDAIARIDRCEAMAKSVSASEAVPSEKLPADKQLDAEKSEPK